MISSMLGGSSEAVERLLPDGRQRGDRVLVAEAQAQARGVGPQEHGREILEQQRDGRRDMLGLQLAAVPLLLRAPNRRRDVIRAESPNLVLHRSEPLPSGGELGDRDHDADVLLEHVPVAGHHRGEERGVVRRILRLHGQARWGDHVMEEGLRQCGQQVFLVVEVAVEYRGRPACRRRDVGQRGAVKTPLSEQLPGRLLDRAPGLSALRAQRRRGHRHAPGRRSPARNSAPGNSCPTTRCATRAASIAAPKSTSTCTSLSRSMYTRSSVAMLPVAPGANGQPPRPPTDASSLVTPSLTAAYALASPDPRVLWKCAPRGVSPMSWRTAPTRSAVRRGVVVPIVSASASRSTALSHAREITSSTRGGGVGPSNGQSHAVATMTSTDVPLSWAIATIPPICAAASALARPTLARLCPSDADTTYSINRRPAAIARLAPFGLATSAENSMSANRANSVASSAASASAGTFDGDTNAVASISRTPVAATASSSSSFAASGIGSSICRPSRSDTSRIVTCGGRLIAPPRHVATRPLRPSCRAARRRRRHCVARAGRGRRCGYRRASPTAAGQPPARAPAGRCARRGARRSSRGPAAAGRRPPRRPC